MMRLRKVLLLLKRRLKVKHLKWQIFHTKRKSLKVNLLEILSSSLRPKEAKIITRDGKVIPNKVAIFDSAGKPMIDANVWSGSEMKVSAELIPYFTAMAGAGVSLRLRAVQITKLVEGGAGNSKGYGFDEVKDGYVAPEDKTFENEVANSQTDFNQVGLKYGFRSGLEIAISEELDLNKVKYEFEKS